MSLKSKSPRVAGALAAFCAAALASSFGAPAAHADPVPGLDGVNAITGLVQNVPLADSLPTNLTELPGVQPGKVVMEENGQTAEYPVQPTQVERAGKQMSALPLTPDQALSNLPATDSLPLAQGLPTEGLNADQLGKINWVLDQASGGLPVPGQTPAGIDGLGDLQQTLDDTVAVEAGPLSPSDVTAATQSAIWHYSTGKKLAPKGNPANVVALYKQLTGPANVGLPVDGTQLPQINAPTAPGLPSTGELSPNLQDVAGQILGPFDLPAGAPTSDIDISDAPEGVALLDEDGNETKQMRAGTKYYLHMPVNGDPGQAVMSVVGAPQDALGTVLSSVENPEQAWVVTDPTQQLQNRKSSVVSWGTENLVADALIGTVCDKDGLSVKIDNSARQHPIDLTVAGKKVDVPAGEVVSVPLNVNEGDTYDVEVTQDSKIARLTGKRYCGGEAGTASERKADNAAGTAGSGNNLPMTGTAVGAIVGVGAVLVVAGAGLYLFNRRRKAVS